jgi:hypothetical protein
MNKKVNQRFSCFGAIRKMNKRVNKTKFPRFLHLGNRSENE